MGSKRLNPEQVATIKHLLETTKMTNWQIALEIDTSDATVGRINQGHIFKDPDRKYPIRPGGKKQWLTPEQADQVIYMLQRGNLPKWRIARMFYIPPRVVTDINEGKRHKRNDVNYPIRLGSYSAAYTDYVLGRESC